jgi:hypothetical protein
MGTRTAPWEYNAWWLQNTLSIYRLDGEKDIYSYCNLFVSGTVRNFITKYSLLSLRSPFNFFTRVLAKKSLSQPVLALRFLL